jgi:ParB family chromosome partitioning protein
MSNKSLGRGLSAFLDLEAVQQNLEGKDRAVVNIAVDDIKENPFQPRKTFNEESLLSLSESIKRKGIVQPILVIKLNDGKYQLIAGERRLRASKMAELAEIPALVTEIDKKDQLEFAILENIQREDLNPIDEAEGYQKLIDEFYRTQEELSEILGKSRSHIANTLRLLTLPEDVKNLVREGKITFGHARAIVGAENASKMAERIVDQSLNVRQTEELMRERRAKSPDGGNRDANGGKNFTDPEVLNVANQISSLIGLQVAIKLKNHGGVIQIEFKSFEELDMLMRKLNN